MKKITPRNKKCKECNTIFKDNSKNNGRVCCSKECQYKRSLRNVNEHNKKNYKGYSEGKIEGVCDYCNKKYSKKAYNQMFCSEECRLKNYEELMNFKRQPEEKDIPWLKLRFAVYSRDNFTCQYCGRNVKEDAIKLNIEHIIPVSKGGDFLLNNLTTSCEDCNYGKGCVLLTKKQEMAFNKNLEENHG